MQSNTSTLRFSLKLSIGLFVLLTLWLLYLDWQLLVPAWLKYVFLLINAVALFGYWRDKKRRNNRLGALRKAHCCY